ncbi:red chlorophyll catabolite reductase [Telopea speciosissima]|uniref:red chlorophyll catabolite reductase n=1 Tax=Telopea speciosissima TaxID=54955 RepID=UPI001CC5AFD5|nr:red chlorophyll catabolite reductase [Telopea speciosissima]
MMISVVAHRFRLVPQTLSPFSSPSPSPTTTRPPRLLFSASSSSSPSPMDAQIGQPRFMEFPHLSVVHRNLMVEIISTMEGRLGSQLRPPTLPPDVQFFQNESGTSQGSLYIRTGDKFSSVDLLLGSWLHCELPSGGALDITTLVTYLNLSTDAPHFLLEFIQSSPTSLLLLLDLLPRKDLVLHQDYLNTFYSDTQLERFRKELEKLPEVQPYFLSSLYLRPIFSPTANLIRIDCSRKEEGEAAGQGSMDEIIHDHIGPIAKEVLGIWLDQCACRVGGREVGESEQALLGKRDHLIKDTAVKIDLVSNLPRLFGPDVASRVISAIQEFFDV